MPGHHLWLTARGICDASMKACKMLVLAYERASGRFNNSSSFNVILATAVEEAPSSITTHFGCLTDGVDPLLVSATHALSRFMQMLYLTPSKDLSVNTRQALFPTQSARQSRYWVATPTKRRLLSSCSLPVEGRLPDPRKSRYPDDSVVGQAITFGGTYTSGGLMECTDTVP